MVGKKETLRFDDFLTVSEAATFLGVSSTTLRNWDRSGKLKPRRHPINKYRLYNRNDLIRILDTVKQELK